MGRMCRSPVVMRARRFLAAMLVISMSAGCVATQPMSRKVSHDPLLARQGGVLLLVDACVQVDVIGGANDYFVINEAESGGQEALGALRKYTEDSGIPVRSEIVSVCGSRLNGKHSLSRVADAMGGQVREAQQPLKISEAVKDDVQYVNALGIVSTFAFERAAVGRSNAKAGVKGPAEDAPMSISMDDFHAAAEVIKDRTRTSSVVFLGVLGNKLSAGKAVVGFVGAMAIGMAVAVATAGLGTGYYLIFVPGHKVSGIVMEGALIDLESGTLTWSNAVLVRGNPADPKAMANPQGLDLLLHGLMFAPASMQPAAAPVP
jgi:hypothetical protein